MMNHEHEQHVQDAQQARLELATDMHDINQAGERLIQRGKRTLKSSAVALGAAAIGGLVVGIALGRASTGRRGNSLVGELLGRATSAFATTLATELLGMLVAKRG